MKRLLAALILTAGLAFAQAPTVSKGGTGYKVGDKVAQMPPIPAASAATLAPLTAQRTALLKQKAAIQHQLQTASLAWQKAAVAAVKAAGLDPTKVHVSPDGTKFVQNGGKR